MPPETQKHAKNRRFFPSMTVMGLLVFSFLQPAQWAQAATTATLQPYHKSCTSLLSFLPLKFKPKATGSALEDWKVELPATVEPLPLKREYVGEEKGKAEVWRVLQEKGRVAYLTPNEAKAYQLKVEDAKFTDLNGNSICPKKPCEGSLSIDLEGRIFFSTQIQKARFHHSSFTAGGSVAFAGEATFQDGQLLLIDKESGHYRPSMKSIPFLIQLLADLGVSHYEFGIPVFPESLKNIENLDYDLKYHSPEEVLRLFKANPDVLLRSYVLQFRDYEATKKLAQIE